MLKDFIDFNPRETLPKGQPAKKVAMEKLRPFCRDIEEFEVAKYSGGTKFRNGDTLLARITPCLENGKTAQVRFLNDGEVGFGSTEYIVLRAKERVSDSDYIYYLSTSPKFREIAIQSMIGSSGRQRVQQDVLEKAELHIPPLDEQRKIAGILSALDDKIELNNKINRNLEAQAQAIFKSWFIDFEPFKNGKFIDSELGKIPEGWSVSKLTNSLNIKYGKNLPQSKLTKTGYPVYGANGQIGFFPQIMYKKPQVLISCRGAASGKVITSEKNSFITNNSLILDYSDTTIPFSFVKYWALSTDFSPYVSGSAQPQITIDSLSTMNLTIPDEIILKKFNNIVIPILDKIFSNNAEIIRLSQLRDILLPRLLSGEINISDYIA